MPEFFAFSIILIIKDDFELIDCCLRSINLLDYPRDKFEVIVIDDGSRQPVEVRIKEKFNFQLKFHYKERSVSSSRSSARNLGFTLSRFENIVFIDGDHFLSVDLLKNYNKYFSVRPTRSVVLGVRKHIQDRDKNKTLRYVRQGMTIPNDVENLSADDERIALQQCTNMPFNSFIGRWHLFWSCNFCIRRELFENIGGFDEQFIKWGFEDVEFGYRLHINGYEFDLVNNYVYHFLPLNSVTPEKYLGWLENIQLFYLKYRDERILMQFSMENVFLRGAKLTVTKEPANWLECFMNFNERLEILQKLKIS